jgi:hypothetical protein
MEAVTRRLTNTQPLAEEAGSRSSLQRAFLNIYRLCKKLVARRFIFNHPAHLITLSDLLFTLVRTPIVLSRSAFLKYLWM